MKKWHFDALWGVRARKMRARTSTRAKFSNAGNDLKRVAHLKLGHLEQKKISTRDYSEFFPPPKSSYSIFLIEHDMNFHHTKFDSKMSFNFREIRH